MAIRINNLSLKIDEPIENLKSKISKELRMNENEIKSLKIIKESIDARKKDSILFNYCVDISCENESKIVAMTNNKDVKIETVTYDDNFSFGTTKMNTRPVIVGMGPAGIFAGLLMAQKGYNPLIIERGECVEERSKSVEHFWNTGKLNLESNVQFGEGGAGTFSDGKLTTRIKDTRCDFVLEELIKAGAPEEIGYVGKPHIGTDILKGVVKNIREKIISLGGEVRFNSKLTDLVIKNNKLQAIIVNENEIPCEALILATGHSSRDTYEMLYRNNIFMSPKPFAIGVRAEHSQTMIDENQYGKFANHKRLKAADYKLTHTSKHTGRGVYSFCMCPGGVVVAAASEEKNLVVNGMSYYKRDKENANSAIVVSVGPKDFEGNSPLAGMEFQRKYERLAYELGGGDYKVPIQLLGDFMKDRKSTKIENIKPSCQSGYEFANLNKCLPEYVVETIKEGFVAFDRKINGFSNSSTVLTGIETRTSAPIRMERNEKLQSISLIGLYPAGEGAGFAGGIISAAVDGLKTAESIMKEYKK